MTASLEDWFRRRWQDALFLLASRLARYPVLNPLKQNIASEAIERAGVIAEYLDSKGYFDDLPNENDRVRWLNAIAFREALRLTALIEWVEAAMQEIVPEDRMILRWCYIDQFNEHDIARLLKLATNDHRLFDDETACQRVDDAYQNLCRILLRRFPIKDLVENGPYTDLSRAFPRPPNISCRCACEKA